MAARFVFVFVSFGLLHIALGHGRIEPLPADPSWCVNGNILEIGECLCKREQEDSCVGSQCHRQMGLSWYKPSCPDCKCKPESAKASPPSNNEPSAAESAEPAQCGGGGGGGQKPSCGGPGGEGKGMPDWFGKDKPKDEPKKKKKKGRSRYDKPDGDAQKKARSRYAKPMGNPQQKQKPQSQRVSHSQNPQANIPDVELLKLLQATQSPLDAERSRRHTIVAVVSFGAAAFFAFLFWMARSGKGQDSGAKASAKAETKSEDATSKADTKKADTSKADTSKADTSKADTSKADTSKADTSKADTSKADTSVDPKTEKETKEEAKKDQ